MKYASLSSRMVLPLFAVAVGIAQPAPMIPDELKSKVAIAAQNVRAGKTAEALALYSEVLAAKADLFTIAVERGKLYQQMKEPAKAMADFDSAIAASPGYSEAYFRRCVAHYESGAFLPAIADCGKAIEINPEPAAPYFYRGAAYNAMKTWDKAAADLVAATGRNNQDPDAHLQLGRAYSELDQLILALREYTVALQQRPGFAEAYKGRSSVKAHLGDAVGSKEDLSKVN
jgi:tetratricopeptide (TPR) repeat protein